MSINPNPVLTFGSDFVDSGSSAVDRITNDVNFSLVVAGLGAGDSVAYQYSTDAGNSWITTAASQSNLADGSYQVRALITYESGYGFEGELSPGNWIASIDGNGSIDISQSPLSIALLGADDIGESSNPPEAGYRTDIVISSPVAWTASFDWNYSTDDFMSSWDPFGYLINGNFYQLTIDSSDLLQSGSVTISLNAGDVFGFRQGSVDAAYGRASVQISGFVADYSSVYSNVQSFAIDSTAAAAPSLALTSDTGVSATDGITNDGTINVTGLEAGASWQYSTNSGSDWISATGSSFAIASDTYDAGSILVRQSDIAGNTSAIGQLGAITIIDSTAAAAPSLALASDTGISATDGITNDSTINVTGLEAAASWQYSTNGGGNWTNGIGSSFEIASGTYAAGRIRVRQSDIAGNTSAIGQTTSTIVIDTTAPTTTAAITAVADNFGIFQGFIDSSGVTDDTTPTFSGLISAALVSGEALYLFNGDTRLGQAVVNNTAKTWSCTLSTPLPNTEGANYTITARVGDLAGNLGSASSSRSFLLDTSAPAITASITGVEDNFGPLTGFLPQAGFTDDTSPTFSGTLSSPLSAGDTLRIYSGTTWLGNASMANDQQTWSFTSQPLANGFYAITAQVADAAGNLAPTNTVQRFSIDSTSNQIIGDANANTLTATTAKDVLTGLDGIDTFRFSTLGSSLLTRFDRITDFAIGTDILDGPTAVSAANINKLGAVSALSATSIAAVLTTSAFAASRAATFTFNDPSGLARSFIALNNASAGYQSGSDAIIEITGYTGSLNNLQIV